MKIAIVHISDLHIISSHDVVVARAKYFLAACRPVFQVVEHAIFVVSGDIANTGTSKEYEVAYSFFNGFEQKLREEHKNILTFDWVLVPGNHDCHFVDNEIRGDVLRSLVNQDTIDIERQEYLLLPQKNYWEFYKKMTDHQADSRISFQRSIDYDGFTLCFNCYNTALLSQLNEVVGSLIVPTDSMLPRSRNNTSSVTISVFHHSTGWLSPNTESNNKKRFENHIVATSDVVICGHEHEAQARRQSSLTDGGACLCFEGAAFQDSNKSAFAILVLDSEERAITKHDFEFVLNNTFPEETRYKEQILPRVLISMARSGFLLRQKFEKELLSLPIPVKHPHKDNIRLDDIFIYPDLEKVTDNYASRSNYEDSTVLLENNESGVVVVEGEAQSGKSSLLFMLYLAMRDRGLLPVYLRGRDISHPNVSEVIRKAYRSQYDDSKTPFDAFSQSPKDKKILIIDNVLESSLNESGIKELYTSSLMSFQRVIVTVDDKFDYSSLAESVSVTIPIIRYRILSLGSVKRNHLIEKWLRLGLDPNTLNTTALEREIKLTFDNLDNLLGEQFLPAYPFHLLALLQSLNEASRPFDTTPTYYAYCYNSLLIASFNSVGLSSDKQKGMLKFISELAFFMFEHRGESKPRRIARKGLEQFYETYTKNFLFPFSLGEALDVLSRANLFKESDCSGEYKFVYKYLYFFLVAQVLSRRLHTEAGRKDVEEMCSTAYLEDSANILLFLVYHSGEEGLIENLIFTSMIPFEQYDEITLGTDDPIFASLNNLIGKVEEKIIDADKEPEEERRRELERRDEEVQNVIIEKNPSQVYDEIANHPVLRDLNQAIRSIRILGQIVKNQRLDIKKDLIVSLLKESYKTCFRVISFYGNYLTDNESDFIEYIERQSGIERLNRSLLQSQVRNAFMPLLYDFCLKMFSNLSFSVGTQGADDLYTQIADEIGTPAAKLISFTIKSYYGPMDLSELESLSKEFAGNPMAGHILRSRVLKYVYTNTLSYKKKQQIGDLCDMKLVSKS